MSKKKEHFSNKGILPSYELASQFCYFLDLYESISEKTKGVYNNPPLDDHKAALADEAKASLVDSVSASLLIAKNNHSEIIKTAIDFLADMAKNERNKEIAIVNQYIEHLKTNLPKNFLQKNPDIRTLIIRLQNFSENPNSVDIDTFYQDLIICLNTIRNTADAFTDRIEQLISTNRRTVADLAADNYLFRIPTDIEGTLKNIVGLKERRNEQSFTADIQEILVKYMVKELNNNNAIIHQNFVAIITGLLIDFEKYLQDKKIIQKAAQGIAKDALQTLFDDYINSETPTYYVAALREGGQLIKDISQQICEGMGFTDIAPNTDKANERLEQLKKYNRKRKNGKENPNVGREALQECDLSFYNSEIKMKDWTKFQFDESGETHDGFKAGRHGTLFEMIQPVLAAKFRLGGTAATDVISINLGTLKGDIDISNYDLIAPKIKQLTAQINNFAKKNRKDRLDSLQTDFEAMNGELRTILKQIDDKLTDLQIPEDLFIYHDSLKLYVQMEEHKTSEFEGRKIGILTALDEIYSMAGLDDLKMIDKDILTGLALNLSKLAIGHELRPSVENYLSIFAGILMFDDIQNMAMELAKNAQEQISYQNIKNIHMYQLNDIYIPGSMLLTYISEALASGYQQISATNAAKVKIDAGPSNSYIKKYLKDYSYGSGKYTEALDENFTLWAKTANTIASKTKIQIIFLASFITLLNKIQNRLS